MCYRASECIRILKPNTCKYFFITIKLKYFFKLLKVALNNHKKRNIIWAVWFGGLEFSQRLPLCVS